MAISGGPSAKSAERSDIWGVKAGRIATMMADNENPYGMINDGVVIMENGQILWCGSTREMPDIYRDVACEDFGNGLITPGLIDCHTHVVFGGNRAREFEMRLEGASYEELARAGGGIRSTVAATRAASEDELLQSALKRVDHLIAEGVTTLEVKSGYGLDHAAEIKMLRVARAIGKARDVHVTTTYLGAHAVPPEYEDKADAYIDLIVDEILPDIAKRGLADAVDGFCETIAFSRAQIARVLDKAIDLGLPIKLHAEQLSDLKGAKLAAEKGALSADHLEYLDRAGVRAMAAAGTVAVLLPGAFYCLRETQVPPVQMLRDHQVPIALATDANPGSSPLTSLLLTMNMACTLFRMTPEEALRGVTLNAAKALGIAETIGSIAYGKQADLAIWDVEEPAELAYRMGFNPLITRIFAGAYTGCRDGQGAGA